MYLRLLDDHNFTMLDDEDQAVVAAESKRMNRMRGSWQNWYGGPAQGKGKGGKWNWWDAPGKGKENPWSMAVEAGKDRQDKGKKAGKGKDKGPRDQQKGQGCPKR